MAAQAETALLNRIASQVSYEHSLTSDRGREVQSAGSDRAGSRGRGPRLRQITGSEYAASYTTAMRETMVADMSNDSLRRVSAESMTPSLHRHSTW